MIKKKLLIYIECVIVIVAVLALSLTGCLKIGMKENNVRARLDKAGAIVTLERTSPITQNMQSGYKIGDILLARLTVSDVVDGEDKELDERAYIFFTQDARSADAVENACKSYVAENAETLVHWNVYRYEEVIVCGHFKIVNIVRQY